MYAAPETLTPALSTRPILRSTFTCSLEAAIAKASLVSFDVFDTLLRRPYLSPTHLFDAMERQSGEAGFATRRRAAEKRARSLATTADIPLSDIYALMGSSPEEEILRERDAVYPRPDILEWLRHVLRVGKPVAAVSDMYLPKDVIADMLAMHGIRVSHLIVSAADNVTKGDGSAFRKLSVSAGIPLASILHVGDNPASDYGVPAKLGMQAVLIGNTVSHACEDHPVRDLLAALEAGSPAASMVGSVSRDVHFETGVEPFWTDIGRYYAGPLAFGFAQWLQRQVAETGIKRLAFVARDGVLPMAAFTQLSPGTPSTYLHLNRSIVLRASLDNLIPLSIMQLTYGPKSNVSNYVTRLGPGTDALLDAARAHFNGDPVLGVDVSKKDLAAFFLNQQDILTAISRDARALLIRYLAQHRMLNQPDKIALADIGWHGTTAALIRLVVPEARYWKWFFIGTSKSYHRDHDDHRAMYFRCGEPKAHHDLIFDSLEIFEFLFSSPETTAVALTEVGGTVQPVFADPSTEWDGRAERMSAIAEGVREVIPRFVAGAKRHRLEVGAEVFTVILNSIMRSGHPRIVTEFSAIQHQAGFGDDVFLPLLPKFDDTHYWSNIWRIVRGRKLKGQNGVVYWKSQQHRHFLQQQRGHQLRIAKLALAVFARRSR